MTPPRRTERRLAYFAWGAVCLIWGTTYLGIRVSLESIPPALMGGLRWTARRFAADALSRRARPPAAAAVAVGRHRAARVPDARARQRRRRVRRAVGAERARRGDGRDVAILDGDGRGAAFRTANGSARVVAGLVIGFSGIVLLVWPDLTLGSASSRGFLAGIVALQIASIGWSIGSSYSKRHGRKAAAAAPDSSGLDEVLGTTAYQMLAGGLMMTAVGTLRGEWSDLFFTTRTTVALVYMSTIGAIGGFVAYTYALRHLPVSFVSLYAYINPVIAVALGVLVLHEPFTWRMALPRRWCLPAWRSCDGSSGARH